MCKTHFQSHSDRRAKAGQVLRLRKKESLEVKFVKRFVRHKTQEMTIRGIAPGVDKLILLCRFSLHFPKYGETWLCRQVFDSKPDLPTKGILFVSPVERKISKAELAAGLKRDADGNIRFQWAGDFLTDGNLWFPRVRPQRRQWRNFPIASVPAGYWEGFLSGLEGKLMHDLLEYRAHGSWKKPAKTRIRLTERQEHIKATLKAIIVRTRQQMWQGQDIDAFSVGKCVVFFVPRPGQADLYVVDNPGPGALYLFARRSEAYSLAKGEVTRTDLIKTRARRILHTPGWQERLAEVVSAA